MIVKESKRKANEKIEKYEKNGQILSKFDKSDIYKNERKSVKRKYLVRGMLAALGLSSMVAGGVKTLSSGSNVPEKRVTFEYSSDESNKKTDHIKFAENIKIPDEALFILNAEAASESKITDEYQKAHAIIDSIIESYNKKYETQVNSNDLKYLKTTNEMYVYENEYGDYIFDPSINLDDNRNYTPAGGSYAIMYSILDSNSRILFSVGEFKNSSKDIPTYKLVDIRTAYTTDRNYHNIHEEGNYLHTNEINLNMNLEENSSIEQEIFKACEKEFEKVINNEKSKGNER